MRSFSLKTLAGAAVLAASFAQGAIAQTAAPAAADNGVMRVKSSYSIAESAARIKADLKAKGITFFQEVDQQLLAQRAGIQLRPSTLLEFGNPALGTQFITGNADAGLDWPVRLLLTQDDAGQVWAVWSDFTWIAKRHNIHNRDAQFNTATGVVASVTSTLK